LNDAEKSALSKAIPDRVFIVWSQSDEDTLLEIFKTHGKDYDLMAKATGFTKQQC
jgi:hypothetical protein